MSFPGPVPDLNAPYHTTLRNEYQPLPKGFLLQSGVLFTYIKISRAPIIILTAEYDVDFRSFQFPDLFALLIGP